jgi:hypothetical protein
MQHSGRHLRLIAGTSIAAIIALAVRPASAQSSLVDGLGGRAGYGGACLGPNDDGSSDAIDLTPYFPGGLRFFGERHTSAYVNTNGNITFSGPVPSFTPRSFPVADRPMIAPYWADVDIRRVGDECTGSAGRGDAPACHDPSDNGVWWFLEEGRMVVTWDRVGYYNCNADKRMSFQLIVTEADGTCSGSGDFDVEFRYSECEWTTGDASGGSEGFGGTPAQAGFDAGNEMDWVEITGSRTDDIHRILCNQSNIDDAGVWRFEIRNGAVVCPDAGMPCDTGMLGVCADGLTECVADRTECVPEVAASEERCDNLDNDCDGELDEGDDLCDGNAVCEEGRCVRSCFEFGCPDGQTCTDEGECVDPECVEVSCGAGQRCVRGECIGACDEIRCPTGQQCRAGRCVDLCAMLSCDACTVCDEGMCVPRCQPGSCPRGKVCLDDGSCIDEDCEGVDCRPGTVCVRGRCVDPCARARCPSGEVCEAGECVFDGPAPTADAGVADDAGTSQRDGVDASGGGSSPRDRRGGGSGCVAVPASAHAPPVGMALAGLAMVFVAARRRR